MRALQFIRYHVIFKLRYNQIYQLKTTHMVKNLWIKSLKSNFEKKYLSTDEKTEKKFLWILAHPSTSN